VVIDHSFPFHPASALPEPFLLIDQVGGYSFRGGRKCGYPLPPREVVIEFLLLSFFSFFSFPPEDRGRYQLPFSQTGPFVPPPQ